MPPLKKDGLSFGRREFLAGLGGVGVGLGLGKASHWFPLASPEVGKDWAPGQEGFVNSTCLLCPSHCGIRGRVVDGALVRIDGNPMHPVSRGGLCSKGKAGLQTLYHPERLTGALERAGSVADSGFAPLSWDSALERIAGRLRSLRDAGRPDAVAWLGGDVSGCLDEVVRRFVRGYGSPHMFHESYEDGSQDVMEIAHGLRKRPAFDLDRADLVLSFGAPLSEAWWCLPQAARARVEQPTQSRLWVQVDTRLSRTAIGADEWFPIRPGAYGDLAVAMAYVLLKEGLYDSEFVQDHVTGFEDWNGPGGESVQGYRSLVLRHGRPDDVADRIGLPADEIVRLAKLFGRARRPVALWDHVVGWSRAGLASSLAIHALNVLAGSIQRPGGLFFQPSLPVPQPQHSATASYEKGSERSLRGDDWADRVLDPDKPRIEVLFLHYSNPLASAPNPEKIRRALERIPLLVSFSPFLDESTRLAHVVLPDHTYLERWQDAPAPATVPYSAWGIVQPVVAPLHDTRATGDVVLGLASRIAGGVDEACPWSSMEELVRERGRALAAAHRGSAFVTEFRAAELRELEARGWWLPHEEPAEKYWEIVRDSGGWFDPFHDDHGRPSSSERADGRIALFPEQARRRIAGGVPGLVGGFLPLGLAGAARGGAADKSETEIEYPLRLVPYRVMTLASGSTSLMPWLLEKLGPLTSSAWETWVEINPDTGRELGLVSGHQVRVASARGDFTARLRFFEGAQPGVVNVPYGLHSAVGGWPRPDRTNPLAAVGDRRDPISGLPDWYSTRVRIEPAQRGS